MNVLPDAKQAEIAVLLSTPGMTKRKIGKMLGIAKNTVDRYAKGMNLPPCPCGEKAGHRGWCNIRFAASETRQAFMATIIRTFNGVRPPCLYLGFLHNVFDEDLVIVRLKPCAVKACPWPAIVDGSCKHHKHFFEFSESMTDNRLDRRDLFNAQESSEGYALAPEFPIKIASLERSLRFECVRNGKNVRSQLEGMANEILMEHAPELVIREGRWV